MDEFQKHILQSNHVELVNTIDVSKSSLLDQLIQYDVISAGEEEEILTQKTRRDQNTKLLYIIKRRKKLSRSSDTYGLFRSALQEDYGFLASKLSEGSVSSGHVRESSYKCLYCLLLANLIPSDVTHHLFQEGLISDDDLDHLNDGKFPRLERVKSLLGLVESSGQTSIDFFILKLEKKYDFIASHSKQHKEETLTICFCQYIENDAIERTKLVFNKEIGKTFPNDKSLMKKCSNLWSTLFDLRERGDWKRHAEITDEAFRRFTDPDLLIMLYRSEMCVSTFYMNDSVKADKMFEKAKTILPETRMSNWHLSRILPLRINSLIKQNKQDEASKVLQEAHQTMDGLKPCLSTGAVYFFEAMFLASNLKSNPNGTKSQEISKRVKDCFITAILHYKKEKYFKIKSFLNQVYLFLALFCLGVDLNLKSEIQYISVKIISRDDIEIAGHYLNKYETECWEISTNWSQMLFYIARAEEHKHRKNFRKCLDYLKQAKYCADNGNFKEHEKFIDFNFEFVSQKIEQQKCHNEKDQLSVEMLVEEFLGGSDDESESQSESDA